MLNHHITILTSITLSASLLLADTPAIIPTDKNTKAVNHFLIANESIKTANKLNKDLHKKPSIISNPFASKPSIHDNHAKQIAPKMIANFQVNGLYHTTKSLENGHPLAGKQFHCIGKELDTPSKRKQLKDAYKKSHMMKHTLSKKESLALVRGIGILEQAFEEILTTTPGTKVDIEVEREVLRGWRYMKKQNNPLLAQEANKFMATYIFRLENLSNNRDIKFDNEFANAMETLHERLR